MNPLGGIPRLLLHCDIQHSGLLSPLHLLFISTVLMFEAIESCMSLYYFGSSTTLMIEYTVYSTHPEPVCQDN